MEITANAIQTVPVGQTVPFTDTVTPGNCAIMHREGSGLVTIKGNTNQCRARYKVSFGGNIAIPTGGIVGPISLAIAVDGEPINSTNMIQTPAAVDSYHNVFSAIFLDVPRGCCMSVSVRNTSTQPINVQNANLIVERMA